MTGAARGALISARSLAALRIEARAALCKARDHARAVREWSEPRVNQRRSQSRQRRRDFLGALLVGAGAGCGIPACRASRRSGGAAARARAILQLKRRPSP